MEWYLREDDKNDSFWVPFAIIMIIMKSFILFCFFVFFFLNLSTFNSVNFYLKEHYVILIFKNIHEHFSLAPW